MSIPTLKQHISILGSTGSIGTQTLDIVGQHPEVFEVVALSANGNWRDLADQVNTWRPQYALLCDENNRDALEQAVAHDDTELLYGYDKLPDLAELNEVNTVVNALVGFSGFLPTIKALNADKKLALANKESLVVGGALINRIIEDKRELLVPVDSEHSAMLQCIVGEPTERIEKIVITASGGPFRTWTRNEMQNITVEDALDHPNWSMGAKITVDSATMMNKGLEIIEAHWLFDLPLNRIEAVVHPQSIIHSIVSFVDGSSKAQLGPPDMKVPIQYALTYPDRLELDAPRMDWKEAFSLTFEPVDYDKFPCLKLARDAVQQGDFAPAVLNAANEVAVERFLDRQIDYIDIPKIVDRCLQRVQASDSLSVETLNEVDRETRNLAKTLK